jgi:hypothetical protein
VRRPTRGPFHRHRATEAASKAYFNGYRRLENPHQNCVDSLSLGTLRNGLSCLRLALRPFLCLPDHAGKGVQQEARRFSIVNASIDQAAISLGTATLMGASIGFERQWRQRTSRTVRGERSPEKGPIRLPGRANQLSRFDAPPKSSPFRKNFPLSPSGKSILELAPSRAPQRGVSRSSRHVGRGMRWMWWRQA